MPVSEAGPGAVRGYGELGTPQADGACGLAGETASAQGPGQRSRAGAPWLRKARSSLRTVKGALKGDLTTGG